MVAVSFAVGVIALGVLVAATPVGSPFSNGAADFAFGGANASPPQVPSTTADVSRCGWLEDGLDRHLAPSTLAADVLRRMTVHEKLGEIVLVHAGPYENIDAGVPRLCIPALTLQDGPQGLAYGDVGVTQLPAPLGIAATFDPGVAEEYGQVLGSEAAGQGIDVIQGPTLNIDRVPQSGRSYEGFGEDPLLVSAMGVADTDGIQSTGTMAMAKHFAVYNQETDRGVLNVVVPTRALEELYLPPFEAAVSQAHISSVMCAYPQLDGTYQCQDKGLLDQLTAWGFTGFVRSDLESVHDPVAALEAGTDLLKPASVSRLDLLVREHRLAMSAVNRAVTTVLTTMFAHGLVDRVASDPPGTAVDSDSHTDFALTAAERSAVLLKNVGTTLPLDPSADRSLAVIGAAATDPVTTGYGSSRVVAPFISSPLEAIRQRAGPRTTVSYVNGGSTTGDLHPVPTRLLTPANGVGHGLTLTLTQSDPDDGNSSASVPSVSSAQTVRYVQPTVDISLSPHPSAGRLLAEAAPIAPVDRLESPLGRGVGSFALGREASPAHTHVVLPAGWSDVSASWTGTLTPPRSGLYTFSLQGVGAATLTLDGVTAVADPLSHGLGRWSQSIPLTGGHPYRVDLAWEPDGNHTPSGESSTGTDTLTLGFSSVSGDIEAAVAAARRARTAVIFAGSFSSEAVDRPSLSLPGDENALITAVAAANPRTVVVLNTGGAVLMPWLGQVKSVIEAWYPGEEDGTAIASLLYGDVDPSGRLPVTFPASTATTGVATPAQWPGVDLTSTYSEGLDVGYRYDHADGIQPLFPFGFGLDYTRFSLSRLSLSHSTGGFVLRVRVSNRGGRTGIAVPQAYLTFPAAAGEPPAQLKAFTTLSLAPGQSGEATLTIPDSAFQVYLNGGWTRLPGTYLISVGQSSDNLPLTTALIAP